MSGWKIFRIPCLLLPLVFLLGCETISLQNSFSLPGVPAVAAFRSKQVVISSSEPRSRYCLDGKLHGNVSSRITIDKVEDGDHLLTVFSPGNNPYIEPFSIDPSETQRVLHAEFTYRYECKSSSCMSESIIQQIDKMKDLCEKQVNDQKRVGL